MKTTILIEKNTAERVMKIGERLGHKSMSATAEFLIRNACLMIEKGGVDSFISGDRLIAITGGKSPEPFAYERQPPCIEDTSSCGEKA